MKAEPESRVVNGVDVAFSADTFERVRTSAWEGVRNYQARNYLRDQMHVGDQVLFYHSNCHVPGVVALAHVCKEGYPDPTAFDPQHPYYDAKSSKDAPRWFMVDVEFDRRLRHPVPLALLQHITSNLAPGQREDIAYLTDAHIDALSTMPLLHRSRLSIQVRPLTHTACRIYSARRHRAPR